MLSTTSVFFSHHREEEEELLAEWTPEPLVPEVDPDHPALHVPVIDGKVVDM